MLLLIIPNSSQNHNVTSTNQATSSSNITVLKVCALLGASQYDIPGSGETSPVANSRRRPL